MVHFFHSQICKKSINLPIQRLDVAFQKNGLFDLLAKIGGFAAIFARSGSHHTTAAALIVHNNKKQKNNLILKPENLPPAPWGWGGWDGLKTPPRYFYTGQEKVSNVLFYFV